MFINEQKAWKIVNSNLNNYTKLEKLYQLLKKDIEYMLNIGVSTQAILYTISKYFNLNVKLFEVLEIKKSGEKFN